MWQHVKMTSASSMIGFKATLSSPSEPQNALCQRQVPLSACFFILILLQLVVHSGDRNVLIFIKLCIQCLRESILLGNISH
jgi:hypothetical protein